MHSYIKHLLSDISNACRMETQAEDTIQPRSFEEEMAEIEEWIEGKEADFTFGYYCGLDAANFPPAEQLTDEEMQVVMYAFRQMMASWNLDISLPESLPLPIAYAMTIDTLNTKTAIVNSGTMCFDFCTGYAPDCIFKEYCPCLRIWNEGKKDYEVNDTTEDPPF